jgi:hypothetical protein
MSVRHTYRGARRAGRLLATLALAVIWAVSIDLEAEALA